LEFSDGECERRPLHVTIGVPRRLQRDWYCPVRFKGLPGKKRRIFGVDAWQALILALKYVEINLRHEARNGMRLYWLGKQVAVGRLFAANVRT
jgi:hypothetical protein